MATEPDTGKQALQAASDRIGRLVKELKAYNLAVIEDRWDPRLEALQRRVNGTLADLLGDGSPDEKRLRIGPLAASLDTSFGDRFGPEEMLEALRQGVDGAIANLNTARDLLKDRLSAAATPEPASAPAPAHKAAAPKPTPAPTPEPSPAPAPAPEPEPEPESELAVSPEPAPEPAPESPAPAPDVPAPPSARPSTAPARARTSPMPSPTPKPDAGQRIAIVSSVSGTASAVVAKFLGQLGFETSVVSAEAPAGSDAGAAMDRLEPVRGADFAVVLLPSTGLAGGSGLNTKTLLDVGFLYGALSRPKVLFLVQGQPQVAPELEGIVRVLPMDGADLWRLLLAREMRRSGLDVDMNRAV